MTEKNIAPSTEGQLYEACDENPRATGHCFHEYTIDWGEIGKERRENCCWCDKEILLDVIHPQHGEHVHV